MKLLTLYEDASPSKAQRVKELLKPKDPSKEVEYAIKVLGKMPHESIMKSQWPEAEPYIMRDSYWAKRYKDTILGEK